MLYNIVLLPALILLAGPTDAGAASPVGEVYSIELRGAYWNASLDATIRSDSGDLDGTDIDLAGDLGIDKSKGLFGGDLILRLAHHHKLRLSYLRIAYEANKALDGQIVFNGETYPVGMAVRSNAAVDSARLGYEYDIVVKDRGYLGFQLAVNYLAAQAELVTDEIVSSRVEASVAIPLVAATGRVWLRPWLSGTAEVAWMGYGGSNTFDGAVYLDFNPARNAGVTLGYRFIMIELDTGDEKIDVRWNGLFAGFVLRI